MSHNRPTKRKIAVPDSKLKEAVVIRHRDNGPLHDLLLRACPPNAQGEKSITILAGHIPSDPHGDPDVKISPAAIHKWVRKGKLAPDRASQVVDVADGRVTLSSFSPFIYSL